MDVAYINPFIVATRIVFDTMIHVPFMLGRPHLRERAMSSCAITATIQLSGPVSGAVVLCLPESVAMALASGFSGTTCSKLDADCLDALGEMVSMISGNAKKDFPAGGVTISTPKVSTSGVIYPQGNPVIVIPCTTSKGKLALEVALRTPPPPPPPT